MSQTPTKDPLFREFPVPTLQDWMNVVNEDLKGADFEKKLVWKTLEGIDVRPMYTEADIEGLEHLDTLPGIPPFVRSSTTEQSWHVDQEIDVASPVEANRLALLHLKTGQSTISFDLPLNLRRGLPLADGEPRSVFNSGVCIESGKDMRDLLDGIDLDSIFLSFQAGYAAPAVLDHLKDVVGERGGNLGNLKGALNYDPVRYLATCGMSRGEWDRVFDVMAQLVSFCKDNAPGLVPVTVSSFPWHYSGATAVQEIACVLSTGVAYLHELTQRGFSVDEAAKAIRFEFYCGANFSFEVAKLRAARLLWARIMDAYKPSSETAMAMNIHGRTSLWSSGAYDPYVNMLRGTVQTLAVALGGAQTICTEPFDAALGDGNDFSLRIARNTQIVLKEESHFGTVIDPAAGSWFYEYLTDAVAKEAWTLFQEVESRTGIIAALEEGWIQERILVVKKKKEEGIASRREVFIGINQYPNISEKRAEWRWDALRVKDLDKGLNSGADLLYGGSEITGRCTPLHPMRGVEAFEHLRDAVESMDRKPVAFLATLGPVFWRRARATFASGFLGSAGFSIIDNVGFSSVAEAAEAARERKADIVVLCSDDESYPTLAPELTAMIKAANPNAVMVVAGFPKDAVEALRTAGVDEFIHMKADALTVLTGLAKRLGVPMN